MGSVRVRVGVAALLVFVVAAAPAAPDDESSGARLTFVRNGSIFVASADGRTGAAYLRAKSRGSRTSYYFPAWSPDGRGLAVGESWEPPRNSTLHGYSSLVVFRQRGTSPPSAGSTFGGITGRSSWSPNGRQLVYCSIWGFGDPPYEYSCDLWIVNVSTKASRGLTSAQFDGDPAWSPDGKLIAFEREEQECVIDPNLEVVCPPRGLYVIAPTGGRARRLTRVDAANPSWSPDGRYIAFDDRRRRIGIVSRRGGRVRFIATGTSPAWSPDGTTIAFVRNGNVWLVGADGKRPRLAFRNAYEPAWRRSPR